MAVSATASAYAALTESAGFVDRSDRGKLLLTGPDAAEFLNGQVTNEIVALEQGAGCYAALLTVKGKMQGDLRVLRLDDLDGEQALWLDTERAALQALFDTIRRYRIGYRVELHKRTLEQGLLSLIGPETHALLGAATGLAHDQLPSDEHAHRRASLDGVEVMVVATDLGLDIVCAAADTLRLHAALLDAGIAAVEATDAEIVRVESGRPRYGVELDDATIPQEAGLNERAVSFTKGCYVGQETVARLYYRGKPNRHLRGLRLSGPADAGATGLSPKPLWLGEREVGRLGSAVVSPRFGPIGLALVRREAAVGDELRVGEQLRAQLVDLPFA
jgi:folate-binding protein YgfZ